MSSASSTVTYTSVYTDFEPGRVFWPADEELSDGGSPRVIVYGYDGLPIQPVAPSSPDYVPGPEHPPSPIEVPYVPEPEYPEYLVPSKDEAPLEDQPLPDYALTTALSLGYVADSDPGEDPEEDSEEEHADYPVDEGDDDDDDDNDDDDDDDTDDEDEEPFEEEEEEEEEEHLALADPSDVPVVDPVPLGRDTEAVEAEEPAPTPRSPQAIACIAKYAAAPTPPLPPPSPLSLWSSLLPQIPSPPLPPPPSSLHIPPPIPTSLLPPLPDSLFIPPVDRREDIPEAELPPRQRLCLTTPTSRYEVGESSTAVPRPTGGYTWVDPTEATEEIAPVTLEGVNTRVTNLVAVQEPDTQDIYVEALVSREAWAHSMGLSSAVHYERSSTTARTATAAARAAAAAAAVAPVIAAAVEQLIEARLFAALANHETLQNSTNGHGDGSHNSGTRNRGTTRIPRECTYKDFLNCRQLNFKGTKGVIVLAQWFERMESVFHISNCAVENQVKFATFTFIGNALTWWNSHMKVVTQDVAYAMDWKALKKMMTVKYYPRGEIKKLEIELWNLKVKGTDIASYTLRFQELALMCGHMFPEESDEVEKYVGGLPDMIRGNVMSYRPQTMEEAIEFANDQMDQKLITISERQAEQKRKMEYNAGNNQGHQQPNKTQNTRRAYTAGTGEKREYTGSLPLCTKCNYHHKGPCAPRCNKCKKIGHLARDCRSSGPN
ncbi:putative reverse transcriptase domain-containing protein, partial [Tanacetum coccineum]